MLILVVLVMCVSAIIASAIENAHINIYPYNVNDTLSQNRLVIVCDRRLRNRGPFKNILNVEDVQMFNCPPPDESYADELKTINVNTSVIQELFLTQTERMVAIPYKDLESELGLEQLKSDMLLKAKYFKELKIKKLRIENYAEGQCEMTLENSSLDLLTDLKDLILNSVHLPPLIKATNLKMITVKFGSVSGQKFSNCNELRELNLTNTFPENVSSHWLENCAKLEILRIQGLREHTSQQSLNHVLEGATNLQELKLSDCDLNKLPWDLFTKAKKLRKLELRNNNLNEIVLRDFKINSLNYLGLSGCEINSLKGLPVSNASQLEVNLSENNLNDVQLEPEDYDMLKKNNMTVKVAGPPIYMTCYDCKNGLLWRAVREKRLIIDVRCNEGVKLGDADLEVIDRAECETYNCKKASQCQCLRPWSSGVWLAHCENAKLQTLPTEPGLQKLYAAGNDIKNINAADLFDSLKFLDLRNNSISLVNAAAVEKLFSIPERHMLFSGNPIACVCDNKALFDALLENHNQIDDYENITCVSGDNDAIPISKLDPTDLCTTLLLFQQFSSLTVHLGIALAVLTVICSTLLVLYNRYKLAIKVYLYTRSWCLCCVHEEELDADRIYDAFVSFCHENSDTVVEELVPKLESPPCSYKLCVHYRDWVPGELISDQIKTSVAQSRRTIIVLSRNYMKSVWGLMEFREAHINTLREGRVRVIVIVLDDVLEDENLDPELRAYLKANTYVKWGDPWFWDKLKYALPHKSRERNV